MVMNRMQTSTNLLDWNPMFTTNSPAMPFSWADTNAGNFPQLLSHRGRAAIAVKWNCPQAKYSSN
jgi:hypothetical protein